MLWFTFLFLHGHRFSTTLSYNLHHRSPFKTKESSPSPLLIKYSQLPPQQICNHLPSCNNTGPPKCREIKRTTKRIGISKAQHGRNPTSGILKSKTSIIHLILFYITSSQMVNTALGIDFWLVRTRDVGGLCSGEDVEVVVCCVTTCVTLCANCCSCESVRRRTGWN